MRKVEIFVILVTLIFASSVQSAFDKTFLGNARYIGMSGAYISLSDDEAGVFVNPAGLSQIDYAVGGLTAGSMYAGMDVGSLFRGNLSGAINLDRIGAIGIGLDHFSVSAGDNVSYSESMYVLSYAYQLKGGKSVGVNIKIPRWGSDLEGDTTYGITSFLVSIDVGVLIIENRNFSMGAVLYDINQPAIGYTGWSLPFSAKFGCSYRTTKRFMIVNVDAIYKEESMDIAAGAEFLYNKLALRGGVYLQELTGGIDFSLGAGYRLDVNKYKIDINYAFKYSVTGIGGNYGTHFISTSMRFDTDKSKSHSIRLRKSLTSNEEKGSETEIGNQDEVSSGEMPVEDLDK